MTNCQISQGYQTATAGTPVRLVPAGSGILAKQVFFQARKNATTANTGVIFLTADNGTAITTTSPTRVLNNVIGVGDTWRISSLSPNHRINLANIWLDVATSADGVQWTATL